MLTAPAVEGAFLDPVLDAQAAFRAIMDAMASPGRIRPLPAGVRPPAPLSPALAAVALTLCDGDTPLWLDAALRGSAPARAWLAFHCGVPIADGPGEARFALATTAGEPVALEAFAQGTEEYPDRSTTLVLQVASLTGGRRLGLAGPGIDGRASFAPTPLPPHFIDQWTRNNSRFPRGVDVILAAPDGLACLPRTTRILAEET